jgi:pimeloyl-ACP methyl ester carboxylesterase
MVPLAEAGYRVIAPYMRGYAPSDIPAEGLFGVPALAQDGAAMAEELCRQHDCEQIVLLGHDWGAAAAYGTARLAPGRIHKLITLAVPHGNGLLEALLTSPEQQRRSWYMFFFQMPFAEMAVRHDGFRYVARLWHDWSPGYQLPADEWALLVETLEQPGVLSAALDYYRHSLNPTPEVAAALSAILPPSAEPPLIQVPTLYLHGRDDGCIGSEVADGMEKLFPSGLQISVLDGVGHFLHQEDPARVNVRILEFLAGA